MTPRQSQSGFTLIELLLYIATASILLLAISSFAILLSESRLKHRSISEVEQQGYYVMDVLTQAVRNAESVTSPTAGSTGTSLTLDMPDSALDPTVFAVTSGVLQVSEGSTPTVTDLTSGTVTVSDLSIRNLSRDNTAATVQIDFTLTTQNPSGRNEFSFTQQFTSSATVRYD